ncbi:thioredoxin domain-containing protein [Hymenobacter crusticola]|uniref:Thioredoxin domain-containing protein n=1 Tax=Hymenobacter crusticola TaxID=1770526 RepID=A0A243W8E2_9BACT|nr:hypothetical protein [Hymenobacter crusticola]OUJ71433.1 hypothetical protein BXP70_22005 [Hymenobacter crusticola]
MPFSQLKPPRQAASTDVLLVLLPPTHGEGIASQLASTNASLDRLQTLLEPAIRILRINEASHPAVVSSFHATELPAFVFLRQGIELWRHQGLPDDEAIAPLLLRKINS